MTCLPFLCSKINHAVVHKLSTEHSAAEAWPTNLFCSCPEQVVLKNNSDIKDWITAELYKRYCTKPLCCMYLLDSITPFLNMNCRYVILWHEKFIVAFWDNLRKISNLVRRCEN